MDGTRAPGNLLLAVLLLAGLPACHDRHAATSRHGFGDVGHWVAVFDDPARDAWQRPADVVAHLGLGLGMTVADLGAGTGYMSGHLARAVGPQGRVLAVETEPALVEHLRERAVREGTPNVTVIRADRDDPHLPPGGVDVILILDTYHHLDDRVRYLGRLSRALRPDTGRIAVVDWKREPTPVGPPVGHRLARERVVEEMAEAGFVLHEEPAFLPYQYVLIFTRRSGLIADLRTCAAWKSAS